MAYGDGGMASNTADYSRLEAGSPDFIHRDRSHDFWSYPVADPVIPQVVTGASAGAKPLPLIDNPVFCDHELDLDTAITVEGVLHVECRHCSGSVRVPHIPGGLLALRLQAFMVALLGGEQVDESPELMEEFVKLRDGFAEEAEAFQDAVDLLQTAERIVARRLAA